MLYQKMTTLPVQLFVWETIVVLDEPYMFLRYFKSCMILKATGINNQAIIDGDSGILAVVSLACCIIRLHRDIKVTFGYLHTLYRRQGSA